MRDWMKLIDKVEAMESGPVREATLRIYFLAFMAEHGNELTPEAPTK